MTSKLEIDGDTWLLALSGAGISAESGLATFRGAGGLWEGHSVEAVATPEGFRADARLVWRFYSARRAQARQVEPNAGHRALAETERRLRERFLLVTQNVDELHRRAGSQRLIEIHGRLFQSRCAHCDRPPFDDDKLYDGDEPPLCDVCEAGGRMGLLRPHVVWFGEALSGAHFDAIADFLARAEGGRLVFLAVGTSGVVYPVAGLVDLARQAGADAWLVNAEPADNVGRFHHFVQGASGAALPELLSV